MAGRGLSDSVDLVVEGLAYVNGRFTEAAIAVLDGEIVSVSKPSLAPRSYSRRRYWGKVLLLPGMVDIHVHMREPGLEYKEDWYTGSLSALRGGVTAVFDMPNNRPPTNSRERLLEKARIADQKSLVDFGLYAGVPRELSELEKLRDLALGVKLYPEDLGDVYELASTCANLGLPLIVHPEDPSKFRQARGPRHDLARPPEAEVAAVHRLLELARRIRGLKVHFTHVSLGSSISLIVSRRLDGLRVTFDCAIHHALLDSRLYETSLARVAKVNPQLRSSNDRRAVYNAIKSGTVDAVITDHAPHALEEKNSQDWESVPPGFPGLEIALPLLLTEIVEGRMGVNVLELYSSRPASLYGVAKGALAPGYDADVVVVEYGVDYRVSGLRLASKAKYTPFEGWRLRARVVGAFLRGDEVLAEGEPLVGGGYGKFVRRFRSRVRGVEA